MGKVDWSGLDGLPGSRMAIGKWESEWLAEMPVPTEALGFAVACHENGAVGLFVDMGDEVKLVACSPGSRIYVRGVEPDDVRVWHPPGSDEKHTSWLMTYPSPDDPEGTKSVGVVDDPEPDLPF